MVIGFLRVDLLIPNSNSLKDKRSVIKKHLHYLRKTYNVAVAETGNRDLWRRAELSFITINSLKDSVERTLRQILHELDNSDDVQVIGDKIELL